MPMSELIRRYWLAASAGLAATITAGALIAPPLGGEQQAAPEPSPSKSGNLTITVDPFKALPQAEPQITFGTDAQVTTPSPSPSPTATQTTPPTQSPAAVPPPPPAPAPAPPPPPAVAPPAPAPAPAPAQPAPPATDPNAAEYAHITAVQQKYNTFAAPGTRWIITNTFPSGCRPDADGCTVVTRRNGQVIDIVVYVRPGKATEYIIIHEIAHTRGIRDECRADQFFREQTGSRQRGFYC